MNKFATAALTATALLLGTTSLVLADDAPGKLTVATIGEPATLDVQLSPVLLVNEITQHIFETLYAFDSHGDPKPLLAAAMPTISADGLTVTIPLRTDVTFQNGEPMKAADVAASLNRWEKINSKGKEVAKVTGSITAGDDHTIVFKLTSRYAPLTAMLSQYAAIMPASTLAEPLTQFVGTGPFMLKERKPDQYIELVRYPGYKSPDGTADGYAGHREADVDELVFTPVPDANTRVEGLLSGQYDYADNLPISAYQRLQSSDVAKPVVLPDAGWMSLNFNTKEGLMSNLKLREAVEEALNADDLMAAAFDNPKFFDANGALFPKSSKWYTEAGMAHHGKGDMAAAQKLMKDAGYDGQPIRILTTRQYEFHYKLAQVAQAYLEAAGFKVDLQVMDWASLTGRRAKPDQWDIFVTNSVFPPDPALENTFAASYPGWYDTEGKTKALTAYLSAEGAEAQMDAWKTLQTQFFQDAPLYKVGDYNGLSGVSDKVAGLTPAVWPFFWNTKVGK